MAKYYCILFDADNTLLNFDAAENKALAETLVNYGIEPDAETVQTYRTINEELWRQLEKGQIRREKLFSERFSRFLKTIDAAGDGVEMNRFYLEQLSSGSTPGTIRHRQSASAIAGISPPVSTKSPMEISSSTHSSMNLWSTPS